jgi:hypothetical protein
MNFQLFGSIGGQPNINVYLPLDATRDLECTVENTGTFPEEDLTCFGSLLEWVTYWNKSTEIWTKNISGIDLAALGGEQDCNYGDFTFDREGVYGFMANITEPPEGDDITRNNLDIWGIGVDDTKPESSHVIVPAVPDGDNGWYVNPVECTVTAEDPESHNVSSDVYAIKYKIGTAGWQTIEGPTAVFTISEDAENLQVQYYAVDNVGNEEATHSFNIDMDQTIPDQDEVQWEAYQDGGTWYVRFTCNSTDATSGMDRVEFYIADTEKEIIHGTGPTYQFEIMWSTAFEVITFWFYAYDVAGNMAVDDVPGDEIYASPYIQQQQYWQKQPQG